MGWYEADPAETVRGLTPAQRNVLRFIAARADGDMVMFWGQDRIAHYLDMSRRSVVTAMQVLEERGLIRKQARGHRDDAGAPQRSSNMTYLVMDAVLAQALPEAVEKYHKLMADRPQESESSSTRKRKNTSGQSAKSAQSNRPSNSPKSRQASLGASSAHSGATGGVRGDAMPFDGEEEYTPGWVHVGSDEPAF